MRYLLTLILSVLFFSSQFCLAQTPPHFVISKEKYIDKCKGAWLGQMIGVTFADRYEFRFNGVPILEPLVSWSPDFIERAFEQDDLYVEMTFLEALETYGIDINHEQAGTTFAKSQYPLWHANQNGRDNLRKGIIPPLSGYPLHNPHADDIDFQIESDLFGIISPGLPQEAQRLCYVFGSIMNYGDGLYGGMFISAMYASAFIIDDNVEQVILNGLRCIPPQSEYRKCIEDTIRLWRTYPNDWLEAWKELEHTWQDDIDCIPNHPVNIDAKLNGAYVVMGLLYGNGDLLKTLEIATRCGQDTDCNASSAGGILCCMKGLSNLESTWKEYLPKVSEKKFIFTNYSWNTLIDSSVKIAEKVVLKTGGKIENDSYHLPIQPFKPPATFEQWTNQQEYFKTVIPKEKLAEWNSGWRIKSCANIKEVGIHSNYHNKEKVLVISPHVSNDGNYPAVLENLAIIPAHAKRLTIQLSAIEQPFNVVIKADYKTIFEETIHTSDWKELSADITPWVGKKTMLTIEIHPANNQKTIANIAQIRIE